MYALICSRTKLREMATGATHKTIYMPTLEAFHLCAPVVDEQRRIVGNLKHLLTNVETARLAALAQLRDIAALPQRLLTEAFGSVS